MDRMACPLLRLGSHRRSDERTGFPTRLHLVLSCKTWWWHFAGGYATPGIGCLWNVDYLGTCITDWYIGCVAFYHGILTLWWNCCGAYVCIAGQVTTIDNIGTDTHTRAYVVGCTWASSLSSPSNECSCPPKPWCWLCLFGKWKHPSGMVGRPGPSWVGVREEHASWY
jgi:hypothetical protein